MKMEERFFLIASFLKQNTKNEPEIYPHFSDY